MASIPITESKKYSPTGIKQFSIAPVKNNDKYHLYDCYIEEWEADSWEAEGKIKMYYRYTFNTEKCQRDESYEPLITTTNINEIKKTRNGNYRIIVSIEEENLEKAIKIGQDRFAKYKADMEGVT